VSSPIGRDDSSLFGPSSADKKLVPIHSRASQSQGDAFVTAGLIAPKGKLGQGISFSQRGGASNWLSSVDFTDELFVLTTALPLTGNCDHDARLAPTR
jgi:hypothetical protein